ncbi:hypothetical protein J0895_08980 [Phormidium pseudopriestleyi FRX01]|uniref:Uncharacterized protein n=1 Tax=Phormidium pseudopriestleyi FRX01 TaxID=1759528 RepID=A0ABS3FQ87_9CYAN|nr:hypothetical protein [Phormidium pseudopriestleyi]MBO0349235.1 hypothetical protein [Phormidium pseudopriestleyi FRX01]
MSIFAPTHKLIAPAGEENPVMLFSKSESHKYRVISEIEHFEGSEAIYEWHPCQGVTYRGFVLNGLKILPLEVTQGWQYSRVNSAAI